MTARLLRSLLLLLLPLGSAGAGCVLRPDHVTVYVERNVAETTGERRTRTVGGKAGVSATFDLPR